MGNKTYPNDCHSKCFFCKSIIATGGKMVNLFASIETVSEDGFSEEDHGYSALSVCLLCACALLDISVLNDLNPELGRKLSALDRAPLDLEEEVPAMGNKTYPNDWQHECEFCKNIIGTGGKMVSVFASMETVTEDGFSDEDGAYSVSSECLVCASFLLGKYILSDLDPKLGKILSDNLAALSDPDGSSNSMCNLRVLTYGQSILSDQGSRVAGSQGRIIEANK